MKKYVLALAAVVAISSSAFGLNLDLGINSHEGKVMVCWCI